MEDQRNYLTKVGGAKVRGLLAFLMISLFFGMLAGCGYSDQKVEKILTEDEMIPLMEDEDILNNYQSIKSASINKEIQLEKAKIYLQSVFVVQGNEYPKREDEHIEEKDYLMVVYAVENTVGNTAVEVIADLELNDKTGDKQTSGSFEVDVCDYKMIPFLCRIKDNHIYTNDVKLYPIKELQKGDELSIEFDYTYGSNKTEILFGKFADAPQDRHQETVKFKLPDKVIEQH